MPSLPRLSGACGSHSGLLEYVLPAQVCHDLGHAFLHAVPVGMQRDLWRLRWLVGGIYAGEVLDLAGARLAVQALGVALLAYLDGRIQENFDELARLQQLAHQTAVGTERRYESGDHDHPG